MTSESMRENALNFATLPWRYHFFTSSQYGLGFNFLYVLLYPGLYIGAHGLYTSEVIHLKRKFGQWKGGKESKKPTDIEFYEYVEAVKLTGDPYVPAGKVSFVFVLV